MKPLYIQFFYEGCPEVAPMIGTPEYPVYYVGLCGKNSLGSWVFELLFPPQIMQMFEGKMVNIWTEHFDDKILRNVLFSKQSGFLQLEKEI